MPAQLFNRFALGNRVELFNRFTLGNRVEVTHPAVLKAALTEFISTFIFVFAGTGSTLAMSKVSRGGIASPDALVAAAIAHAFALFVAVSISTNVSGGHVNPAVTFVACLGGHITVVRGLLFWIAQLLGSVVACFLLEFVTDGMTTPSFGLSGVNIWSGLVFEITMTFGLVYTVYATALDPNKGDTGKIAPIAIGFIVGANILVGGAFTGASMNPALWFGPALLRWSWTDHWVYWAGPLIGGGLAGIVYEFGFMNHTHVQLPSI